MKDMTSDSLQDATTDPRSSITHRAASRRKMTRIAMVVSLTFAVAIVTWKVAERSGLTTPPGVQVSGIHTDLLDAIDRAKAKLQRMPRSADAWGNYGMLLMQNERPSEALTCFDEAIRYDDANPKWYYFAGTILEQTDLGKALNRFESSHTRKPDYVPTMLKMGTIRITMGQFDQAEKILDSARVTAPGSAEIWVQLVRLKRLQGQPCDAVQLLVKARSLDAISAQLLQECAIALMQCRQADHARSLLAESKTVAASSGVPDLWLDEIRLFDFSGSVASLKADSLRQYGQIDEASRTLASLSRRFPDRSRPALNLALMLRDQGQVAEATQSLNTLVEQFPDDPLLRFHQAVLLAQTGSPPDVVIAALNESIRMKPDYGTARAALADVLARQGKHEEALIQYEKAVQSSPGDPWIRFAFVSALIEQGQEKDAESQLEQLAALLKPDQTDEQLELVRLRRRTSAMSRGLEKPESIVNP